MKLPISLLTPARRPDVTEEHIQQLAESIRTIGLINPVTVDENNNLIAGRSRILAVQSLGWTEIEARRFDELTEWQKLAMEIEENIRRINYTEAEELKQKLRLHNLYVDKYGKKDSFTGISSRSYNKWKVEDTAQLLGISTGATSQDLKLARAIEQDPELAKLKTKAAIKSAVERKEAQRTRKIIVTLITKKSNLSVTPTQSEIKSWSKGDITLYNADCLELIPTLLNYSISCLITDPPWEVQFDAKFTNIKDGLELTERTLELLLPKLQDGALCWMFCATKHLITGRIRQLVMNIGYRVFDQILIWYKPHIAHSSNPYMELKNDYEPALLFTKGTPRQFNRPEYAVQSATIQGRRIHPAQKPVSVLETIVEISTVEGEVVFDPFCGSGQTLVAARNLKRKGIGCEKDELWYSTAIVEVDG